MVGKRRRIMTMLLTYNFKWEDGETEQYTYFAKDITTDEIEEYFGQKLPKELWQFIDYSKLEDDEGFIEFMKKARWEDACEQFDEEKRFEWEWEQDQKENERDDEEESL